MRLLDLFSGIGGFSLAASWVWGDDLKIVSFCEIDPFCRKVLKKHWPDVPIIEDIRDHDFTRYKGTVDILTGGFPCQPVSVAGNRKGQSDRRWLWPSMLSVVSAVRPRWVFAENTANLKNMGLDEVVDDLEAGSYETGVYIIPAYAVGLPHKRERTWIVAHSEKIARWSGRSIQESPCWEKRDESGWGGQEFFQDTQCAGLQRHVCPVLERAEAWGQNTYAAGPNRWDATPRICGRTDGIPNRMDRLKGLGNAIVPQVAEVIFRAIKEIEDENH